MSKDRITQLANEYGMEFIETEESYTSKASFLDSDYIPNYGEKLKGASGEVTSPACDTRKVWKASGKRASRGLYRSANYGCINADCNGAANIIIKVSRKLGLNLSRLCRGALRSPYRIPRHLWGGVVNFKPSPHRIISPVLGCGQKDIDKSNTQAPSFFQKFILK